MGTRKLRAAVVSVSIVLQFVILCTAAPKKDGPFLPNNDPSKGGQYQAHTDIPQHGSHPPQLIPINHPTKGGGDQKYTYIPQHGSHPPQNVPTNHPTQGGGHRYTTDNPEYTTHPVTKHDDYTTYHDDHSSPDGPTGAKIIATTLAPGPGDKSYYLWWVVGLAIAALLIIVIAITVTCLKNKSNFNPNEHTPLQDDTQQQQTTQYN